VNNTVPDRYILNITAVRKRDVKKSYHVKQQMAKATACMPVISIF